MSVHTPVLRAALVAALAVLAAPAPGAAAPTPLPVGSTWVLGGDPSLERGADQPVSFSRLGREGVSADGRFVAFSSTSDGLSSEDDDRTRQVYVHDRTTGAVTLVSRTAGGAPANGSCDDPAISADGGHVAFVCTDPLVAADTDGAEDVYVRRWRAAGPETVLASPGAEGIGVHDPSISGDGRYVALATAAAQGTGDTNAHADVYRVDLGAGAVWRLVSRHAVTGAAGNGASGSPSISDDGTAVVFRSAATDLLDVAVTAGHVYRGTLLPVRHQTSLVDRADGAAGAVADAPGEDPVISGDGTAVAWRTEATNLGAGGTGDDVFVRDGTATHLVSGTGEDAPFGPASISRTGDAVAYLEFGPQDRPVVRLRNVLLAVTETVAQEGAASQAPMGAARVALAGDAGSVAAALYGGLTPDAEREESVVYVRDRATGTLRNVSRPPGSAPFVNTAGHVAIAEHGLSARGDAALLIGRTAGVPAGSSAVVQDLRSGAFEVAARGDGPAGTIDTVVDAAVLSADGRHVAWATRTRVVPADTDRAVDVYVRDLDADRTRLASVGAGDTEITVDAVDASIDGRGRRVSFTVDSENPVAAVPTSSRVYVRDLEAGTTVLASADDGSARQAAGDAEHGRLSADGTKLAFVSTGPAVAPGDGDAMRDVFVRDLASGRTTLVSRPASGPKQALASGQPRISGDGTRVAFRSDAELAGPTPGPYDVYLRDLRTGELVVVSRADGAQGAIVDGAVPNGMSGDGQVVAFSTADPAVTGAGGPQPFVRDLRTARTSPVVRPFDGGAVQSRGQGVALSGDGACAAFYTDVPILAPGRVSPDFVHALLTAVGPGCLATPTTGTPADGGTPGAQGAATGAGGGATGAGGGAGSGTGGSGGDGTAVRTDRTAPRLTAVALTRSRFRVGARSTALAARRTPAGTALRLTLSEAATTTVTVRRAVPGRRSGRRCVASRSRVARGRRCTVLRTVGTLRRRLAAGRRSIAFSGRLGRKALGPGRHRLVVQATDAAGNRSAPRTLTVTVVRR